MKPPASLAPEETRISDDSRPVTPLTSGLPSGLAKIKLRGHLNYREIITRFERQSTFHGISHAALAPNTKWRVIWYTAFTICFCALLVQVIILIRRYRSYAKTVDLDMEAYTNAMISGSYGVAAALESTDEGLQHSREKRTIKKWYYPLQRYYPVHVPCACELDPETGKRYNTSCLPLNNGNITEPIEAVLYTECICQYDLARRLTGPCYPDYTWEIHTCADCSIKFGNCTRYFAPGDPDYIPRPKHRRQLYARSARCCCQVDFGNCLKENYFLHVTPEELLNRLQSFLNKEKTTTKATPRKKIPPTPISTTTQTPEIKKALGFEELKDEIAIKTQAQQNLMFAVGGLPDEKQTNLSQTKEEFILKCSFNQKDCDIERDFTKYYDHTYGNCYTFNWNRTKAVTAHRAGANYGLRVLLNANVDEYLPTSESVGFRITIHDKWNVPFPDAFGYSAPTGTLSSFGVRMKQFNRIPAPHGQCLEGGEENPDFLYKQFNYSVEGCHRSCTQKEVVRICGCADPTYPRPGNVTYCRVGDPKARECIKNTSQDLGKPIAEGHVPNCVCHQPCKETNYEVTYSAARWPSGTAKVMECEAKDVPCLERYRENAAMLQIFYEELNYETLTESPAYTLASALADLGGLTGLWIGASVVSLLEIVALVVYTVQAYVRKKKLVASNQQIAHPSLLQKLKRRSKSASVSHSVQELRKISAATDKFTKHSPVSPVLEEDEKELSSSSEDDTPTRNSSPYLPPGEDLPCDCIYNEEGRIEYMKALCPEHGYLVRRKGILTDDTMDDDSSDDESSEEDDEAYKLRRHKHTS